MSINKYKEHEFTLMVLLFCGDRPGAGAAEGPGKAELVQFEKRDFIWVKMPPRKWNLATS